MLVSANGKAKVNKSLHIDIRVSVREHAAIQQRAHAAGISMSHYLRQRALQDTDRPVIKTDIDTLRKIYRLLRNASNNLNQCTRALNVGVKNAQQLTELRDSLCAVEHASNTVADFLLEAQQNI